MRVTSPQATRRPMFGITHRHTIDHAPALPRPFFRFPDGTTLPIYAEDEEPAASPEPASTEGKEPAPEP